MTAQDDRDPRLAWTDDGPRSSRFGDVYFSREDGLAETRAVFLDGCGLPGAWAGRGRFTAAELGFGTGLNIAALLHLWARHRPRGGRLSVFSVEAYPLSRGEAGRALSAWPELRLEAEALLAAWPAPTPGFHRLDLPGWDATLDLAVGDAAWALGQWSGRADAWFLDGFSPALNPAMWSDAVLDGVAACSNPGARVATFTVAGAVRRGLAERGFVVDKRPGHGRKRERLEARRPGSPPESQPAGRCVVIGAGIAGAAVARALAAEGEAVTVVEAEAPGAGGSGFPAGLVTPRLDVGDTGVAGLYAQALRRAGALYRPVAGAVLAEGVLQLAGQARDVARHARVAQQPLWPAGAMRLLDPEAVAALTGEPASAPALFMGQALAVRPRAILEAWLADAARAQSRAARLEPGPGGWRVLDEAGAVLAEGRAVFLCAGWGTAALAPDLGLSPVRGQADWVEGVSVPPLAWGGYAAPTGAGLLFGATHDRGQTATEAREDDSRRNRETLAARLPGLAARIEGAPGVSARAAVRAVTPDRLPLAGEVPGRPGLFVLGGLGSRGLCAAPLLAEHLVALATGAPSPLPLDAARRLRPERFGA